MTTNELKDCRGKTGRLRCAEVTFRRRPGGWQPETYTVAVVLRGEDAGEGDFARQGELILKSRKGHLFQAEGWTLEEVREWPPEVVPPEPTRTVPHVPRVPLKVGYHQTLSEVLTALGWSHMTIVPGDLFYANPGATIVGLAGAGKRTVVRPDGSIAGLFDALACWDFLRVVGLIAPAEDGTP